MVLQEPETSHVASLSTRTKMMKKYYTMCFLSGAIWAGIACVIGQGVIPQDIIFLALLPAPVIGLFVGYIYRRAYGFHIISRASLSLATLYIGVILFGFFTGILDACFHGGKPWAVILQGIFGMVYGITVYGFVVVLWPLSFLNHWIIGRATNMA